MKQTRSLSETGAIQFEKGRQGIYTDLDTLYDTRLAVIEEIDQALALHLLKNGWCSRLYDRAEPLTKEQYKEAYSMRDVKTLTLAHPTMATDAIRGWCRQAHAAISGTPYPGFCEVFVNIWPYRLTKAQARPFAEQLNKTLDGSARLTLLNFDPKYLTTYDAKLYFSCMMMQDWDVWLEERSQQGDLKKAPIPDVTLYAPKIFRGEIGQGDYEAIRDIDVFSTVEERLRPIVGVEFIETDFFSSYITPEVADMLDKPREAA